MSENLRTYTKALYGFDAVVGRTSSDSWSNPSPCEGWTAADVVAHNIAMNNMIAGFTDGTGAKRPDDVTLSDPAADWAAAFDNLLAALDRPGALQTVAVTPWGEMPVDKFLGFAWVDPVVHTWDLAKATGQDAVVDQALAERGAKQLARAGDSLVGPGRFKAAVEVADGTSTLDTLVALSGRDPGGA